MSKGSEGISSCPFCRNFLDFVAPLSEILWEFLSMSLLQTRRDFHPRLMKKHQLEPKKSSIQSEGLFLARNSKSTVAKKKEWFLTVCYKYFTRPTLHSLMCRLLKGCLLKMGSCFLPYNRNSNLAGGGREMNPGYWFLDSWGKSIDPFFLKVDSEDFFLQDWKTHLKYGFSSTFFWHSESISWHYKSIII
jgi:hypothetical protein